MKRIIYVFICLITFPLLSHSQEQEINPKTYFKSAKKHFLNSDYGVAIDQFTMVIKGDPNNADAYFYRAKSYKKLDSLQLSYNDFNSYISLSKKDKHEVYYELSKLCNIMGDYANSIIFAEKAIGRDKKFIEPYQEKIEAQISLGRYKKALNTSNDVLDVKRTKENYYYKGQSYFLNGDYLLAEVNFEFALREDEKYIDALIGKSKSFYEQDQCAPALKTIDIALKLDESCKECYIIRSKINYKDIEYQDAVDDLSKVLIIKENDGDRDDIEDIYFQRGKYYAAQFKYIESITDFKKVMELDDKYALAYYERGKSHEESFQDEKATKDYKKFLKLAEGQLEYKTQYDIASSRMYKMNKEEETPLVNILKPVGRIEGSLDILKSAESFQLSGTIEDASAIMQFRINGEEKINDIEVNGDKFVFDLNLSSRNIEKIEIEVTDTYGNTGIYPYQIRRTEEDKPIVYIYDPYTSDNKILNIEGTPTTIYVEGNIDDESLIKSITIDSIINVSFNNSKINPTFYANIEIASKNSFQLVVEDYYGNITSKFYYIERGSIDYNSNPMGRTWAFFIENSQYETFDQLDGPQKDINKMKSLLDSKYNFTSIQHYRNFTKDRFERFFQKELRELIDKHNINSILIWYAGHGSFSQDIGYWIPVDGKTDDEMSYYNLNNLKGSLEVYAEDLTHLLIISDACQSGSTFFDAMRSTTTDKSCNDELIVKSKSLQVLTSTDNYEQALDQSQFMEVFCDVLEANSKSCISVERIYKEVKNNLKLSAKPSSSIAVIIKAISIFCCCNIFYFVQE